jgi:hypothetical protein
MKDITSQIEWADLDEYSRVQSSASKVSSSDIESQLAAAGITDGFEAFYYIMNEVILRQKGSLLLEKTDMAACSLDRISEINKMLVQVKDDFDNGATGGTDNDSKFLQDMSDLLKNLLKDVQPPIDPNSPLSGLAFENKMKEIAKMAETDPTVYDRFFPGLGSNIVNISNALLSIGCCYFLADDPVTGQKDYQILVSQMWNCSEENDPKCAEKLQRLKNSLDGFSKTQSALTSISAAERSDVEYLLNQYNQYVTFWKHGMEEERKQKQITLTMTQNSNNS